MLRVGEKYFSSNEEDDSNGVFYFRRATNLQKGIEIY